MIKFGLDLFKPFVVVRAPCWDRPHNPVEEKTFSNITVTVKFIYGPCFALQELTDVDVIKKNNSSAVGAQV